jgi:hypothetical protein
MKFEIRNQKFEGIGARAARSDSFRESHFSNLTIFVEEKMDG